MSTFTALKIRDGEGLGHNGVTCWYSVGPPDLQTSTERRLSLYHSLLIIPDCIGTL